MQKTEPWKHYESYPNKSFGYPDTQICHHPERDDQSDSSRESWYGVPTSWSKPEPGCKRCDGSDDDDIHDDADDA